MRCHVSSRPVIRPNTLWGIGIFTGDSATVEVCGYVTDYLVPELLGLMWKEGQCRGTNRFLAGRCYGYGYGRRLRGLIVVAWT